MIPWKRILKRPETYDPLGILSFLIIFIIGIWSLNKNQPLKEWMNFFLVLIGIFGLLIDGKIVYEKFIKPVVNAVKSFTNTKS